MKDKPCSICHRTDCNHDNCCYTFYSTHNVCPVCYQVLREEDLLSIDLGFEKELERLLNKYSKENDSNTPDFILASYLKNCLENFGQTIQRREKWYGREEKGAIIV